ncbi:MAG: hypothetical protein J1F69_03525 [Clostridiales bacterium]|nr:hypothetical protein [Clostridiales bacterium]
MEGGKQKCSTVADAAIFLCSYCCAAAAATTAAVVAKKAVTATIYCYSTFLCAAAAAKKSAAANYNLIGKTIGMLLPRYTVHKLKTHRQDRRWIFNLKI